MEPDDYIAFPDDPNSPRIDWWSKYFYSIGLVDKAPGYRECVWRQRARARARACRRAVVHFRLKLDKLAIFRVPLESVGEFNGFADFLDTFVFAKPTGNALDSNGNGGGEVVSGEKRGELKGKLFITRIEDQKSGKFKDDRRFKSRSLQFFVLFCFVFQRIRSHHRASNSTDRSNALCASTSCARAASSVDDAAAPVTRM